MRGLVASLCALLLLPAGLLAAPKGSERRPEPSVLPGLPASAQATIPLLATKGRASYLGERSANHQDPGATSTTILIESLRDAVAGKTTRLFTLLGTGSGLPGPTSSRRCVRCSIPPCRWHEGRSITRT